MLNLKTVEKIKSCPNVINILHQNEKINVKPQIIFQTKSNKTRSKISQEKHRI